MYTTYSYGHFVSRSRLSWRRSNSDACLVTCFSCAFYVPTRVNCSAIKLYVKEPSGSIDVIFVDIYVIYHIKIAPMVFDIPERKNSHNRGTQSQRKRERDTTL